MSAYYQRRTDTKNVEITNSTVWPGLMKCYRNSLSNCGDLLNVHLDSTGKHKNGVISEKKEFILLGDLNCDLLSETISKSKHLVHISGYNTYGLTQVIKEATRTTAETNPLTYYIATNKKDNVADSGIIDCGIGDHDLVYIVRHARLPKVKKDPNIVRSKNCYS